MSILIADSGGTKTDWVFISEDKQVKEWLGNGLNPNTKASEIISAELEGNIFSTINPKEIYFYGAGCSTKGNQDLIAGFLNQRFPEAIVDVKSDLYAASHALLGQGSGLVGILGTGANSALFQDGEFIGSRPSFGYLLADEGSGVYIGRSFLKSWLEGEFSFDLMEELKSEGKPSEEEIVGRLYAGTEPVTQVFSSFVPIISKYIRDFPELQILVKNAFRDYHKYFIDCYAKPPKACYMVGSIAYYFQNQLDEVLKEKGCQLKKVLQRPMPGLIDYHLAKPISQ